jgi:HEPN domain-containing protein
MIEKIRYWTDLSEYDFDTALLMLNGGKYLYVGFMCHQSVEKILKAYYIKEKEGQPPFVHNLILLAEKSEIYTILSEQQKDLLDLLNPLNIEARYPTYKDKLFKSLTKEKCDFLIKSTKEFLEWIKSKL